MKPITLGAAALILLGTLALGIADTISVDEEIAAIQEAPAQERVRLMNQFKQRLATMNETEREAAITQLRAETQAQTRLQNGTAEGEQLKTQTQERSRVNQMQQTEDMLRTQEMNQIQQMQQAKDQIRQVETTTAK